MSEFILQKRNLSKVYYDAHTFDSLEACQRFKKQWIEQTKMREEFLRIVQVIE
jgi:hypothetical protein